MAGLIITLLPVSLSQKTSSTHSFGVDVNPVRCLLTAEPDRAEMPSQMEHAMETMMFTFHKFAGDKGYLTKEDLRVLMEKEFPGFLEVSAERLGGDGRQTRFLGPGSPSPPHPAPPLCPGRPSLGAWPGGDCLYWGREGKDDTATTREGLAVRRTGRRHADGHGEGGPEATGSPPRHRGRAAGKASRQSAQRGRPAALGPGTRPGMARPGPIRFEQLTPAAQTRQIKGFLRLLRL